jgi:hypothetical protein
MGLLPPLLLLLPLALHKPPTLRRVLPWAVGAVLSGASVVLGIFVNQWWNRLVASIFFASDGIGLVAAFCLLPAARVVLGYRFGARLQSVYRPSMESLVILALWLLGVSCRFPALGSIDTSWLYLPAAAWIASRFGYRGRWVLLWGGAPLLLSASGTVPVFDTQVWTHADVGLYLVFFVVFQPYDR